MIGGPDLKKELHEACFLGKSYTMAMGLQDHIGSLVEDYDRGLKKVTEEEKDLWIKWTQEGAAPEKKRTMLPHLPWREPGPVHELQELCEEPRSWTQALLQKL